MYRYLIRRLLLAVPTILGVTIFIFLAMQVIPGDPLAIIMAEGSTLYVLTPEQLAAARASLGLDRPLLVQYLDWMRQVASGDLGYSFWSDTPISELVMHRLPITLQIALMTVIFSWLVGVPIGMVSALKRNSLIDQVSRFGVTLYIAMPSYWVGMLFILLTVSFFSWRPPITIVQIWEDPVANLTATVLPALALGLGLAAGSARFTRSAVLSVLHEDYVRTAHAKGLKERLVLTRHVLRNALLPVVTYSGMRLGSLLGGAVAVERAFGMPAMGSFTSQAMNNRDWMVIQNMVLIYGLIFVAVNLIVDISYGMLDPRIRYE